MRRYILFYFGFAVVGIVFGICMMFLTQFVFASEAEPEPAQSVQQDTVQSTGQIEPDELTEPETEPEPEQGEQDETESEAEADTSEYQRQILLELVEELQSRGIESAEASAQETMNESTDEYREADTLIIVGLFALLGGVAGLAFVNKWNVGV